ncbi:non-homologous end-joining DNA ligase [Nitratireductor kimnyeongensis]|uniref:Non-homologous end-joining DNA ligase n=1 Tax=Nitratireductor kimnyeongensis TaxID=430679 RepID=A0ABW0T9Y2_9HYPH|nr:non-homologous end-joining DNA ligase [Nitratireductor kimnyeongensis]QZZ35841.1 non-homologous end-joining DNA ligase [Nitratireductor kimnyeongensis]
MSSDNRLQIGGVSLSSPDKILFEEVGITKSDLARYYEHAGTRMLPHIEKRLVSLVRCPDGRDSPCFFQRHGAKGFPETVRRLAIAEKSGEKDEYLYINDVSGVISAVQMSTLEFHIWGSRIDRLEFPDRLVFDLDPDEELDFNAVRSAAFAVSERLADLGLKTVPLLTGGKGIHVIAPLERRRAWSDVKEFARGFAKRLSEDEPERFLAEASKAKREGRVFVDWLRNDRSATAIAPYSTRAKPGAPVATPVSWDELTAITKSGAFTLADMKERFAQPDPWERSKRWRQSITASMLKSVA